MIGIEVGDAEMGDQAFRLQVRQLQHGVEIGRMLEGPPVELQEIDARHRQAIEAAPHGRAHDSRRHRAGHRAPFGEERRAAVAAAFEQAHAASGDVLRATVVVGHVEAVEAGVGIARHRRGRVVEIEGAAPALHVSNLPQAGDDAADLEAGHKKKAFGNGHAAWRSSSFRLCTVRESLHH
jgi:hypothetical protein